jgi:multidrug transporter EmrE-like cation transporter
LDTHVFVLVLFAAACHAGWNAFLKIKLEPFSAMALIAIVSALVVLPVIPFLGVPVAAAWPWLIASVVFHLGYFIGLTEAYRTGDMGQVYPIARGSAPLMTAIAGTFLVGEAIGCAAGSASWFSSAACSCCRCAAGAICISTSARSPSRCSPR